MRFSFHRVGGAANVLGLAALTFGCTAAGGGQAPPGGGQTRQRPAVTVAVAPVTRGSIDRVFSYSATVQPKTQVNLVPRSTGVVDKIWVDAGSEVVGGQAMATVDQTVLKAQLDQAQANLEGARARLAVLEAGGKPDDVQAARAQLEGARIRLAAMQNILQFDGEPSRSSVVVQGGGGREEDIRSARAALAASQARLNQLLRGPTAADMAAAESAVEAAEANLRSSRAKLELELARPDTSAADFAAARSDLLAATTGLDTDRASLASAEAAEQALWATPLESDRIAAETAVVAARSTLAGAKRTRELDQSGWAGIANKACELPLEELGDDDRPDHGSARKDNALCNQVLNADDEAIRSAEIGLQSAIRKLELVKEGPTPAALKAAKLTVETARQRIIADQARVVSAQAKLEQVQAKPTQAEQEAGLVAARSAVESGDASLRSAQAKLDQLRAGPNQDDLDIARASVEQAGASLSLKEAPFTPSDIGAQRQTVLQLEAQLRARIAPFSESEIEQQRAAVNQALAGVAVARANFEATVITAPFAGVISSRLLSEGALATAQTPILTLASHDVELVFPAEEGRLAFLKPGQTVTMEVQAYPGQVFEGRLTAIAPTADQRTRTFQVKVEPFTFDQRLRPGMFANLRLLAETRPDVVLAPRDAVIEGPSGAHVFVVQERRAKQVTVKVGLVEGERMEILQGLEPGVQVVTFGQASLLDGDAVRVAGQEASSGSDGDGSTRGGAAKPQGKPGG